MVCQNAKYAACHSVHGSLAGEGRRAESAHRCPDPPEYTKFSYGGGLVSMKRSSNNRDSLFGGPQSMVLTDGGVSLPL